MSGEIDCGRCGAANPPTAVMCQSCGIELERRCLGCEERLTADARFCPQCGTPALASGATLASSGHPPEERRVATILFADLSGFTSLSERTDPERVKAFAERALERLGADVIRHGGRVDKYIGDNVMGVFGAPEAHGDDPERAVRAALAMQTTMAAINREEPRIPDLALRIGINTGEVMAGRIGDGYTVIGAAVNLAARLQDACRPGSVLVGETTRRRADSGIEYRGLEPLELRGLSSPVTAFEALDAAPLDRRPVTVRGARIVGRSAEMSLLRGATHSAFEERRPHLVTILGPAGIGKSRLLAELTAELARAPSPPTTLSAQCPAYGAGTPYWAFRELFFAAFEVEPTAAETSPGSTWEQLLGGVERTLEGTGCADSPELIAGRVAGVCGVVHPGTDPRLPAGDRDPKLRRDLFYSATTVLFEALAGERPLLLGIDDLQWADVGTLDLLEHLTRRVQGPLAVLCTARDSLLEDRSTWGSGRRRATTLRLEPLDERTRSELVSALLGPSGSEQLVTRIASRCGGNPLFAEEIAKRVLEDDQGQEAGELPSTVQAVLDARLDALDSADRRLIHHAAVYGERFWDGALAEFAASEGIDLEVSLARLAGADLIVASETSRLQDSREFAYRHGLIQEVAYGRLPKSERARKHAEAAAYLCANGGPAEIPASARHYAAAFRSGRESGLEQELLRPIADAAREGLELAGDTAGELHSNDEALEHYEAALTTLQVPARDCVRISEKLGDIALRAGHTEQAEEAISRCLRLAGEAGSEPEREARLHRKLGAVHWRRGRRDEALEEVRVGIDLLREDGRPRLELARLYGDAAALYMDTGENMLAIYAAEKSLGISEELEEPSASSRAYGIFGRVFGRIGDEQRARQNFELSIERARAADPAELIPALLMLGAHLEAAEQDLERAAEGYAEGLELARRRGDTPAQIELYGGIARLALRRGNRDLVAEATEAGEALAEREGLTGLSCFAKLTRGWLQWCAAEAAAIGSLREAEQRGRAIGRMDVVFQALMLQGWVLASGRRYEAADRAFATALEVCERTGLLGQAVEATAARAINVARDGDAVEDARRLAEDASATAGRLGTAAATTAALEGRGATDPDSVAGAEMLGRAAEAWSRLERPLATARALTLQAWRTLEHDRQGAVAALHGAARRSAELGITPLALEAEGIAEAAAGLEAGRP